METKTKRVKRPATGSFRISRTTAPKGRGGAAETGSACAPSLGSAPLTAKRVRRKARAPAPDTTRARRSGEKGCRKWPPTAAEMTMPRIIRIQVIEAEAARRSGGTRLARSARSEVPEAPTPAPMRV